MQFNNSDLLLYSGKEFNIQQNSIGNIEMSLLDGSGICLENSDFYSKLILGKCDRCNTWYKENFDNFTYDKVLVAGLGLGLIPQDLCIEENCSKIDVVESSQELIDWTNNSGHLDSKINLIHDDIYNYNTSVLYDLIIFDIFWNDSSLTDDLFEFLKNKYLNNLNIGGVLYFPINKKWIVK